MEGYANPPLLLECRFLNGRVGGEDPIHKKNPGIRAGILTDKTINDKII